jgi:hypothetical protein
VAATPDTANLDADARGSERNRRAMLTGSVATLARVVQMGTSLITVPLTLKYLGNERFGLWMAISSVLAMAAFADFGVGNGVLNTVSKAFGRRYRGNSQGSLQRFCRPQLHCGSLAVVILRCLPVHQLG